MTWGAAPITDTIAGYFGSANPIRFNYGVSRPTGVQPHAVLRGNPIAWSMAVPEPRGIGIALKTEDFNPISYSMGVGRPEGEATAPPAFIFGEILVASINQGITPNILTDDSSEIWSLLDGNWRRINTLPAPVRSVDGLGYDHIGRLVVSDDASQRIYTYLTENVWSDGIPYPDGVTRSFGIVVNHSTEVHYLLSDDRIYGHNGTEWDAGIPLPGNINVGGITLDSMNRLHVSDNTNEQIIRWSGNSWDRLISIPTEFQGLSIDLNDHLYGLDAVGNQVYFNGETGWQEIVALPDDVDIAHGLLFYAFARVGSEAAAKPINWSMATEEAVGVSFVTQYGDTLVLDRQGRAIRYFDGTQWQVLTTIPVNIQFAEGLAISTFQSTVLLADTTGQQVFSYNGVTFDEGLPFPNEFAGTFAGLATDFDKDLTYLGENTSEGAVIWQYDRNEWTKLTTLAGVVMLGLDSDGLGSLYYIDTRSNSIKGYVSELDFTVVVTTLDEAITDPTGIAWDPNTQDFVITNGATYQLHRYSVLNGWYFSITIPTIDSLSSVVFYRDVSTGVAYCQPITLSFNLQVPVLTVIPPKTVNANPIHFQYNVAPPRGHSADGVPEPIGVEWGVPAATLTPHFFGEPDPITFTHGVAPLPGEQTGFVVGANPIAYQLGIEDPEGIGVNPLVFEPIGFEFGDTAPEGIGVDALVFDPINFTFDDTEPTGIGTDKADDALAEPIRMTFNLPEAFGIFRPGEVLFPNPINWEVRTSIPEGQVTAGIARFSVITFSMVPTTEENAPQHVVAAFSPIVMSFGDPVVNELYSPIIDGTGDPEPVNWQVETRWDNGLYHVPG